MSAQSSVESKLDCILNIEFLILFHHLKVMQCQLSLCCDCWAKSCLFEINGTGFGGAKVSPKLIYLYPLCFVLS